MSVQPSETSTAESDLAAGEVVGEYVVDGKLGQGAFGTVYRGAHPLIGKQVAIKVLALKYSVDPEVTSRFIAEAKAVNQIRHKNIIDIFSFGKLADGRMYYVMEYLDGEPLDALIDRNGGIPLSDALPILRGIARALDAAHAKSIAHRDLKAENVFLASDGEGVWPKLLDFGIAKLLSDEAGGMTHKTRTGFSIGTPYYMSPEQARGRDVDHRTDLYAFGVLTYVMLVGKYPFDGDDYMDILMKQLQEQPVPASSLVNGLPPAIDEAILWLMAKDPADRPPSCRDAVIALEQAAEGAGIDIGPRGQWDLQTGPVARVPTGPRKIAAKATGSPIGETAYLPPKRRTGLVIGMALAIVALGIGIVIATREQKQETHEDPPKPIAVVQPAPPPPEPAPVVVPVDAPERHTITITVDGTPPNTEVLVAGVLIGTAPGPVQLPKGDDALVLTFKADGFIAQSREVKTDVDQQVFVPLKKKGGGKKTNRDDIIDVFDKKK